MSSKGDMRSRGCDRRQKEREKMRERKLSGRGAKVRAKKRGGCKVKRKGKGNAVC